MDTSAAGGAAPTRTPSAALLANKRKSPPINAEPTTALTTPAPAPPAAAPAPIAAPAPAAAGTGSSGSGSGAAAADAKQTSFIQVMQKGWLQRASSLTVVFCC